MLNASPGDGAAPPWSAPALRRTTPLPRARQTQGPGAADCSFGDISHRRTPGLLSKVANVICKLLWLQIPDVPGSCPGLCVFSVLSNFQNIAGMRPSGLDRQLLE